VHRLRTRARAACGRGRGLSSGGAGGAVAVRPPVLLPRSRPRRTSPWRGSTLPSSRAASLRGRRTESSARVRAGGRERAGAGRRAPSLWLERSVPGGSEVRVRRSSDSCSSSGERTSKLWRRSSACSGGREGAVSCGVCAWMTTAPWRRLVGEGGGGWSIGSGSIRSQAALRSWGAVRACGRGEGQ
jgi:hypothetical protein